MKFLITAISAVSLSCWAYDLPFHQLERTDGGTIPLTAAQEDAIIQGLTDSILGTITGFRDAHPKAHACVDSKFTVNPKLSQRYQAGVFAKPGTTYSTIVRFSSGSSDPQADDRTRGGQGMAVKFLLPEEMQKEIPDIPGEKYFVAKEYYKTFDIISISALKEFVVNDLASYGHFFKAIRNIETTTKAMKAEGKNQFEIGAMAAALLYSDYISQIPWILQAQVGSLMLKLGASKTTNLLHENFNSWVPYAFDDKRAVKYSWVPCANLSSKDAGDEGPNFLGERLRKDISTQSKICFDLYARFHEWWMPSVENAALAWVSLSPDVRLGRLEIGSDVRDPDFCETLSYNPGHALPSQRGIGSTQRARRLIYAAVETRRNENRERKEIK